MEEELLLSLLLSKMANQNDLGEELTSSAYFSDHSWSLWTQGKNSMQEPV